MSTPQEDKAPNHQKAQVTAMKTKMLSAVWGMIENKGMKQNEAAEFLGITQPRVSNIKKGIVEKFSLDKCIELLNKFGYEFDFDYKISMLNTKCKMTVNKTSV